MAIIKEGKVVEELFLPLGSVTSDLPFEEVAKKIQKDKVTEP